MSGLRLRIVFIISLLILGLLVVFTVFRPMETSEEYSGVVQESIIQAEDEWIIQFTITNREAEDASYLINWSTAGEIYNSKTVLIKKGRTFTNIHHVYPEKVKEGKVKLEIYKEDRSVAFEQATYYVSFD